MTFTHLFDVLRFPANIQLRINSVKFACTMLTQSICCKYISTTISCVPVVVDCDCVDVADVPADAVLNCLYGIPVPVVPSDFGERNLVIRIDIIHKRISRQIFFCIVVSVFDAIFNNKPSNAFDSSIAIRCKRSLAILYTGLVLRMLIEISCNQSQPNGKMNIC